MLLLGYCIRVVEIPPEGSALCEGMQCEEALHSVALHSLHGPIVPSALKADGYQFS